MTADDPSSASGQDIDWSDPDWNAYYLRRMQEYIPGITLEQLRASLARHEARQRGEVVVGGLISARMPRTREEMLASILRTMQMKYPDMTMEKLERGMARRKVERLAEKEAAAAKRKAKRPLRQAQDEVAKKFGEQPS
jgi:hypothetical protein